MPITKANKEGQVAELPKIPGGAEFIEDKELAISPEIERQVKAAATDKIKAPVTPAAATSAVAPPTLSPLARQIENVLEEGLSDIYRGLTPPQQADFKRRGEATAQKISTLLNRVKVKMREILRLIRDWLKTIPGINKYFIEQTAKIKAEKIIKLRQP